MKTQTALSEYRERHAMWASTSGAAGGRGVLLSQDSEAGLLEQLPSEWSPGLRAEVSGDGEEGVLGWRISMFMRCLLLSSLDRKGKVERLAREISSPKSWEGFGWHSRGV